MAPDNHSIDPYALPAVVEDEEDGPNPKRRIDTRLPFDFQIEIYAPNFAVCGVSRDISLSGLFIETEAEIPLDTNCKVALLATSDTPQIVHHARVVRLVSPDSGNRGIGLMFTDLGEA